MEDALWHIKAAAAVYAKKVLILVLMEDALWHEIKKRKIIQARSS